MVRLFSETPGKMAKVLVWCTLLCIIPHVRPFGYRFEKSTDDAGILFVPLNRVQLTYDEWHLCLYYDLREYYDGVTKLGNGIEDLRSICGEPLMTSDHMVAGRLGTTIMKQFDAHYATLQAKTKTMRSFRAHEGRTKRAPLEFVGGLMSAVFGVMDSKDADRYNMQIEKLRADSRFQNELIRQQTTIVESTIQTTNSSILEMRARMMELRNDINSMKREWIDGSNDLYMKTHFNMMAHLTTLALLYHLDMAEAIVRILSHDSHDRMTNLIPGERLRKHLTEINREMPKNKELPIDIERENVFQLLSTSTLKPTMLEDRIFLEISFPVLLQTQYIMYGSIPVPAPMGDRFAIITPRAEHFLTNDELSIFVPIVEREVHSCLNIMNQHRVICSVAAPIQNNIANICDIQLLKNPGMSKLPTDCLVQEVPKRNYVLRLPKSNTYFARVVEPLTFRGICSESAENTLISDSGFITVQSGCTLGNDEFSLIAHTVHRTIDERTIIPTFNLEKLGAIAIRGTKMAEEHRPIFIEDHVSHFQELANSLAEVRRGIEIAEGESEWNMETRKQQRTNRWLWATLISAIFAISSFYFFNSYAKEWIRDKCWRRLASTSALQTQEQTLTSVTTEETYSMPGETADVSHSFTYAGLNQSDAGGRGITITP